MSNYFAGSDSDAGTTPYIEYGNNKRIKQKLAGMSPV
ncbi:IS3 family transposase [Bacillus xiapuensis]